ncbi:amidohydrolase [Geodermatophilus sp. DF01-2]|uniref:M20 metallopeptidase family protein n=1 Tax=Geodermatophilus sp. DF01-2 TaxID=2559610 RepID=UPI00107375E6|nr:M20 family metallopeptidase [Geodermatophilus sp. DF01_2]TFV61829.1 amidohydrolase [Geodermatophilus sp. DF01_2]
MDLLDDARSLHPDLVRLRRALHREPEVGLVLPRTQERVLEALAGLPLEISTGDAATSVTAVLRGGRRTTSPTTVLLRGDMDALPVTEERSGTDADDHLATNGAMHACGHDLHTAALVGAARLLSGHRDTLTGDVVFMFQPGEEGWDGAGTMITEGVLDAAGRRADHAYALHVFSNLVPSGLVASRPGTLLSASHGLEVTVRGAGGHGSTPHTAKDPVVAAAEMITALQTMVTRTFDVFDPVVVTVGVVSAGTARNVIPDTARFSATVRRFSEANEARLATAIPRVLEGVAAAHGVDVDIAFTGEYPLTVNDAAEVDYASGVVRELLGEERYLEAPTPVNGSEDFSRVLQAVPGAFLGLGACLPGLDPATAPMNHSPRARFDEAVLPDAAAIYAGLAVGRLGTDAAVRA